MDVYVEKVDGVSREENEQMGLGHELEPIIASLFMRHTSAPPDTVCAMGCGTLVHPEHSWAMASPDRQLFNMLFTPGWDSGLEIKNVGYRSASFWDHGPPMAVEAQVQWSMFVSGRSRWYIAALIGGHHLDVHRIEADLELHADLLDVCKKFYENHILARVPPNDGRWTDTYRQHLERRKPNGAGVSVQADDELVEIIADCKAARETAGMSEKRKAATENRLREAMLVRGASEVVFVQGDRMLAIRWKERMSFPRSW